MSAARGSLTRLPLGIFEDLLIGREYEEGENDALNLRATICEKLISFRRKLRNGTTTVDGIKTAASLLQLSIPSLVQALDPLLTYEECVEFVHRVCLYCAPKSSTAFSLLKDPKSSSQKSAYPSRYIPTSVDSLDRRMRGGFRVGTITELVGKAGTAKSQLAIQLCVMAARYGQGSVYIDTENKVSLERLNEIATRRAQFFNARQHTATSSASGLNNNNNNHENVGGVDTNSSFQTHQGSGTTSVPGDGVLYSSPQIVLDSVDIHKPKNVDELFATLKEVEDNILFRDDEVKRLLVLDSIAAPIRQDFGSGTSAPQRAAAAIKVAQYLKRLADQQNLCVIVINQIGGAGGGGATVPEQLAALGTSWHHCVSTRILLECETQSTDHVIGTNNRPTQHRQATIVKSNMVGQGPPIGFAVTGLGIVEA